MAATVSPRLFKIMQTFNVEQFLQASEEEFIACLPAVSRIALRNSHLSQGQSLSHERELLLSRLIQYPQVGFLHDLLSLDFSELINDISKEKQFRMKSNVSKTEESTLISNLSRGICVEFEEGNALRKVHLVLSEMLFVVSKVQSSQSKFSSKNSALFNNQSYLNQLVAILSIVQAEVGDKLPLTELCEALLRFETCSTLVPLLLLNKAHEFYPVCSALVRAFETSEEKYSILCQRRCEVLLECYRMNPESACFLRDLCIEEGKLHHFLLQMSLIDVGLRRNFPEFFVSLCEEREKQNGPKSPFVLHLKNAFRRSPSVSSSQSSALLSDGGDALMLKEYLLEQLVALNRSALEPEDLVRAIAQLRLQFVLKNVLGMKFEDEERSHVVRLLTNQKHNNAFSLTFINVSLAFFIACPLVVSDNTSENAFKSWIHFLLDHREVYESAYGSQNAFGEVLLLLALHFHNNQLSNVSQLVSDLLRVRGAVKTSSLAKMKSLFVQELFPEPVIAEYAPLVAVTPSLSARISGYLPVHCIHQLLKSRAFSKHGIRSVRDWVVRQLRVSTAPLHSLLPTLIENYVHSLVQPTAKSKGIANEPITEKELLQVFRLSLNKKGQVIDEQEIEDPLTAQLLFFYYYLFYEDTRLHDSKMAASRPLLQYSGTLHECISIELLLLKGHQRQSQYADLYPRLMRLVCEYYPYLCPHIPTSSISQLRVTSSPLPTKSELRQAIDGLLTSPKLLIKMLQTLRRSEPEALMPFADELITRLLPLLIREAQVDRIVVDLFKDTWMKLNVAMLRKLSVLTLRAFVSQYGLTLCWDDLVHDPLCLLRCQERVYRCPPLLEILLAILSTALSASRVRLGYHLKQHPGREAENSNGQERNELKNTLISSQESAAVQLLLEACLPRENEREESQRCFGVLREVQSIICSFLHQLFIEDPNLLRLIHFQGYNPKLVPLTVASIPSMHICFDFIPELMRQPHLEKIMFCIELLSHLCQQYRLPVVIHLCKLTIDVTSTLLDVLIQDELYEFAMRVSPALGRMAQVFPPLIDSVITLLVQCGRIAEAHVNLSGSISTGEAIAYSDEPVAKRAKKVLSCVAAIQNTFKTLLEETEIFNRFKCDQVTS